MVDKITLESVDEYIKPGFYQQSSVFSKLIRNKTKTDLAASLIDAFKDIEICEKLVGKYEDSIL